MRKLIFFAAVTATALLTGCLNSGSDYPNPYAPIEPGIRIYNNAWEQNSLSLDPVGVAIRLEMLLAEAEKQKKDINEISGVYKDQTYMLKNQLLFGTGTTISSTQDGIYTITYVGSEMPILDNFMRRGTYVVDTHGVRLSASSETPWTITLGGDGTMNCWRVDSQSGTRTEYVITDMGTMSIGKNEADLYYTIIVKDFVSAVPHFTQFSSDWNGNFKWMPEVKKDNESEDKETTKNDLSYSTLKGASYILYGGAEGKVGFSLNEVTATGMTYNIPVSAPLRWSPENTKYYNVIMSGTETAVLTSSDDYNVTDFPAPLVIIRRTLKDQFISTQISYNGTSMYI